MNSVRLTVLCAAAALVSACSTPFCDAPGGLCSPGSSNTSAGPVLPPPALQLPPQLPPKPLPKPPPEPAAPAAVTYAVTLPDAGIPPSTGNDNGNGNGNGAAPTAAAIGASTSDAQGDRAALPSNTPVRMALLLPLRSETLGAAAVALKAGFMAAWERDRDNIIVSVIETNDVPQDVLSSYASALQHQDLVVGPLSRSAVAVVAASVLVSKPTIALNYPEGYGAPGAAPLPPLMLAMGLSIEEEARQAAQWAAAEHPTSSALVLTTATPWQRRVAAAFAGLWQRLGLEVHTVELNAPDGYLSDPELVQLRARLRNDLPGLLFSAMGADQTRQLRGALASAVSAEPANPIFSTADAMPPPPPAQTEQFNSLPIYGTSALNPGVSSPASQEMDGVRLLDLPWQIQRDHPAVMVYPHPQQTGSADMERLYALGIDAYRVAREVSRHPDGRFQLDGVTGRLTVTVGEDGSRFERIEAAAIYKNGVPEPVQP